MMSSGELVEAVRPLLFTRALVRVVSNHPSVSQNGAHERKRSFARLMGEFVSLLALVFISEKMAVTNVYGPMFGAIFAFLIPTVLLTHRSIGGAATSFGLKPTFSNHVFVGGMGVLACFVAYELSVHFMSDLLDGGGPKKKRNDGGARADRAATPKGPENGPEKGPEKGDDEMPRPREAKLTIGMPPPPPQDA